jgi:hypothetical protein
VAASAFCPGWKMLKVSVHKTNPTTNRANNGRTADKLEVRVFARIFGFVWIWLFVFRLPWQTLEHLTSMGWKVLAPQGIKQIKAIRL